MGVPLPRWFWPAACLCVILTQPVSALVLPLGRVARGVVPQHRASTGRCASPVALFNTLPFDTSFLPPDAANFAKENAFLIGVLFTIATRLVINEIRCGDEPPKPPFACCSHPFVPALCVAQSACGEADHGRGGPPRR